MSAVFVQFIKVRFRKSIAKFWAALGSCLVYCRFIRESSFNIDVRDPVTRAVATDRLLSADRSSKRNSPSFLSLSPWSKGKVCEKPHQMSRKGAKSYCDKILSINTLLVTATGEDEPSPSDIIKALRAKKGLAGKIKSRLTPLAEAFYLEAHDDTLQTAKERRSAAAESLNDGRGLPPEIIRKIIFFYYDCMRIAIPSCKWYSPCEIHRPRSRRTFDPVGLDIPMPDEFPEAGNLEDRLNVANAALVLLDKEKKAFVSDRELRRLGKEFGVPDLELKDCGLADDYERGNGGRSAQAKRRRSPLLHLLRVRPPPLLKSHVGLVPARRIRRLWTSLALRRRPRPPLCQAAYPVPLRSAAALLAPGGQLRAPRLREPTPPFRMWWNTPASLEQALATAHGGVFDYPEVYLMQPSYTPPGSPPAREAIINDEEIEVDKEATATADSPPGPGDTDPAEAPAPVEAPREGPSGSEGVPGSPRILSLLPDGSRRFLTEEQRAGFTLTTEVGGRPLIYLAPSYFSAPAGPVSPEDASLPEPKPTYEEAKSFGLRRAARLAGRAPSIELEEESEDEEAEDGPEDGEVEEGEDEEPENEPQEGGLLW
ncbi:hypothetical protein BD626DRAFT_568393 [Schizophyllum amplum]|uniref:Uncharacterized protein n=1 Tax=Schizophyllum amplum TaxID=97359 RepID=A0A550CG39_9AGAR|nr:hypothetical protein BD626DRAFT_568393 [Auriculariopsis ampla]